MFKIHPNRVIFQITFGDVTLSAGLGPIHYCEARDKTRVDGCFESTNVEVALLSENWTWMTREIWKEVFGDDLYDNVASWVTPEQLAQLIAYLTARKNKTHENS